MVATCVGIAATVDVNAEANVQREGSSGPITGKCKCAGMTASRSRYWNWNKLPTDALSAQNLDMFKENIVHITHVMPYNY